ncbi:hypothetical protein CY35_12G097300 [Sphagnum magellanicum]|nr:hypothetical protein CY35_12G097300 [Sphagnum magellanicum]
MKRAKLDLPRRSSSMSSDPEDDDEESLRLTLGPPGSSRSSSQQQQQSSQDHLLLRPPPQAAAAAGASSQQAEEEERYRPRRTPVGTPPPSSSSEQSATAAPAPAGLKKKGPHIRPPFPWSTEYRAKNHSLEWILHLGISSIRGEVQCKRCDGMATVEVSLEEMFAQLDRYFMENKHSLHDRAPKHWMVPRLLDCTLCHQSDCVKPIIAEKKREINWLFLLLTQTLGLCTLDQLKFFCKHNDKHRTGAKDRVLYSTYGGLLKQLNPAGDSKCNWSDCEILVNSEHLSHLTLFAGNSKCNWSDCGNLVNSKPLKHLALLEVNS